MNADEYEAKIKKLEDALRPFGQAYELHQNDPYIVSKLKAYMAMDTSVEDWKKAAEVLGLSAQEVEG